MRTRTRFLTQFYVSIHSHPVIEVLLFSLVLVAEDEKEYAIPRKWIMIFFENKLQLLECEPSLLRDKGKLGE